MSLSYQKAWKYLEDTTPLEADCKELCDNACCKGTADDGMLLFPGEERLYRKKEDWYEIKDSHITLQDGTIIKLFICKDQCIRNMRPLSCRIFPLLPYIDDLDYLEFIPDLRGAMLCPLLKQTSHVISPEFIDALFSAFTTLIDDENVLEFIEILSKQNDDLAEDFKRFT